MTSGMSDIWEEKLSTLFLPLLCSVSLPCPRGGWKPCTYLLDLLAQTVPDDLGVAAPQHSVHLVAELRVRLSIRISTFSVWPEIFVQPGKAILEQTVRSIFQFFGNGHRHGDEISKS